MYKYKELEGQPKRVVDLFYQLLGQWVEKQESEGNNTKPGQGTRLRLLRRAQHQLNLDDERVVKMSEFEFDEEILSRPETIKEYNSEIEAVVKKFAKNLTKASMRNGLEEAIKRYK